MYQDTFFVYMMATSKGAKMPRGDKDAIMGYQLPFKKDIAVHFSRQVKEYNEHCAAQNLENKALAEIRDTLLPKLLSGEIQIKKSDGVAS
jgi:type I restriction enzyme, S subunit